MAPSIAPPVTPVAPPPPGARNYTVYFDFDKATLSPSGHDVIHPAGVAARRDQTVRISVTGYTVITGSVPYNQRLSQSRAAAAGAALVEEGVAPDEIVTAGRGKTDLAVPTADGVKQPRNRRVVIVIQELGV